MKNSELLKNDMAFIIKIATDILIKDFEDESLVSQEDMDKLYHIKRAMIEIDNSTNIELPF